MTFEVLRRAHRDAAPEWKRYEYDPQGAGDTVASALERLNERLPDPIRWACSCLQKKCGACAMLIDGVPRLACDTFLRDCRDTVRLEPLKKFPPVADLIVDRTVLRENLKTLRVWFEGEARMPDGAAGAVAYEASRCLQCACCLEVCPNFLPGGAFTGMAGGAPMSRLLALLPPEARKEASRGYRTHVFEGCGKSLACRNVCPAGLDIDALLLHSNAAALWGRWLNANRKEADR